MSWEPRRRRSFQVNSFVEKAYVTLATGVYGTYAWWGEKDKGMLETKLVEKSYTVLVEKSEGVGAEAAKSVGGGAGEYESESWEPSMIIRRTTIL